MNELKEFFKLRNIINWILHPKEALENSFFRYLLVGTTTFVIDFGIFKLLLSYTQLNDVPANLISVFLSLLFNFTFSNFWTFQAGKDNKVKKLGKYAILASINYIFNNISFALLINYFDLPSLPAKALVTIAVITWNFFLYKVWVFK